MSQFRRRQFLIASGAVFGARVLPSFAQERPKRVGILTYGRGRFTDQYIEAFREGMKAHGYAEGKTLTIDVRGSEFSREAADRFAADLVASAPDLLVAQGYGIRALATRTKTIPIVCANSGDMVIGGLIKSLAQPGGNVTGIQLLALDLVGKRIELLRELMPGLKAVAVIADPQHSGEHLERDVTIQAAERLGIHAVYYPVKDFRELDAALIAAHAAGAGALVLFPDTVSNNRTAEVATFALERRLGTVAGWANYVDDGQLISYGPNLHASWRRLAYYAERVLKGANPAMLSVEMPSVLELAVNLKTARAIGLKVPQSILLRADRVIE